MSLHNDINNLAKVIEKTNEKEEKKNALYIKKIELLDELKTQLNYIYNLGYNIDNDNVKTQLIEHITSDKNIIIYSNRYTQAFLRENYDREVTRILTTEKMQKREEEKQEKEEEKKRQEESKRQEEIKKAYALQVQREKQQRAETLQGVSNLLLGLACLVGFPFILIIFFIIGITKSVK